MSSDIDSLLRGAKAYELAKRAIDAMEAHRVWPTAVNFELWLHYVSSKDSEVTQQIASVIESGEQFTEHMGEELAAKHLPSGKLSGELIDAGKSLTEELDSVSRAIESARETSEAYGQQLATASESLQGEDAEAVRVMVETLSQATRRVRDENSALENQLAETTDELGKLREHLEQVRREAMTDGLTNLANRKAFDEALEAACQGPVTLAIVDIDHFKSFNDTWGHQTGDQVIRYVASVIGRIAEAGQRFAARYGGEEFAVIFPGEAPGVALQALEQAREEISSRILKRRSTNEDLGAITISGGIAEKQPGETPVMLLERADEALYASKNAGRNRNTLAGLDEASKAKPRAA
ncbi:GGDEF domain-containing protein [Phenylobacterium sp.]|uniref:GGDEF domain-containing protein n=1 Tax=Phenylobacterium sp. TaxID=1871053 RepID=UPI0025E2273E|nr:GGDEF domain-containing protein [Phenylobacterium sp.]MBX3483533.1 GGDEF domain-containing protein [Phenylobacterium sp.]MCW5759947.1 GGDEF domain-containing protein [Phenylobacterium sp.]